MDVGPSNIWLLRTSLTWLVVINPVVSQTRLAVITDALLDRGHLTHCLPYSPKAERAFEEKQARASTTPSPMGANPDGRLLLETFFQITTAFKPQQQSHIGENGLMKNELKVISGFLFLNSMIISGAVLLYMKGGMRFEKVLSHLLGQIGY